MENLILFGIKQITFLLLQIPLLEDHLLELFLHSLHQLVLLTLLNQEMLLEQTKPLLMYVFQLEFLLEMVMQGWCN